jgi:hypothetical protein
MNTTNVTKKLTLAMLLLMLALNCFAQTDDGGQPVIVQTQITEIRPVIFEDVLSKKRVEQMVDASLETQEQWLKVLIADVHILEASIAKRKAEKAQLGE